MDVYQSIMAGPDEAVSYEKGESPAGTVTKAMLPVPEPCKKDRSEDELDLIACEEALEEYHNNPVTISHEDVAKLLDLE